ncbi:hypothetical protein [Ereboglobus luteus]|uniref:hypothetical protein n=1 Tax=Ereboglobus luteus TaxID=1796921 RepID=UPI001260149A|nr:hypothetical protein [Ereboglobus luteus]
MHKYKINKTEAVNMNMKKDIYMIYLFLSYLSSGSNFIYYSIFKNCYHYAMNDAEIVYHKKHCVTCVLDAQGRKPLCGAARGPTRPEPLRVNSGRLPAFASLFLPPMTAAESCSRIGLLIISGFYLRLRAQTLDFRAKRHANARRAKRQAARCLREHRMSTRGSFCSPSGDQKGKINKHQSTPFGCSSLLGVLTTLSIGQFVNTSCPFIDAFLIVSRMDSKLLASKYFISDFLFLYNNSKTYPVSLFLALLNNDCSLL